MYCPEDRVPDIISQVGQRIRGLRKKVGWSLEELGDRADLHPTFVGDLERGQTDISLRSLTKIASALQVTVGDLCTIGKTETDRSVLELQIIRFVRRQNLATLKLLGRFVEGAEEWLNDQRRK